jgi:hypothetical protein
MNREYNQVYGWLPQEVIANLSLEDKGRCFIDWLKRTPTDAGWLVVSAVVKELGDGFIKYMMDSILEGILMVGDEPTKEELLEGMKSLATLFATDGNILYGFVAEYQEFLEDSDSEEPVVEESTGRVRDPKTGRFLKNNK